MVFSRRYRSRAISGQAASGRRHNRECNHINGVKSDNRLANLEYVTKSENQRHSFQILKRGYAKGENSFWAVLTEQDVKNIIEMLKQGISQHKIAADYNVTHVAIGAIARGQSWRHVDREGYIHQGKKGTHRASAKLTDGDIPKIRELANDGIFLKDIAHKYNVSNRTIANIVSGRTWQHIPHDIEVRYSPHAGVGG